MSSCFCLQITRAANRYLHTGSSGCHAAGNAPFLHKNEQSTLSKFKQSKEVITSMTLTKFIFKGVKKVKILFSSPLLACCVTQLPNHQRESLETSTGRSRIKIHVFYRDLQNTNQDQQIKQAMQIWLTVIAWQGSVFFSVEVEQNF